MIIGLHHLTTLKEGATGEGRAFSSVAEAILAKDQASLDLNAQVRIRLEGVYYAEGEVPEGFEQGSTALVTTTLGRALFNETLPSDYPYVEDVADKGKISSIVNDLAERYPKVEVAAALDRIKDAGFYWATRSGVTVALSDILTPKNKGEIIGRHEKRAAKVQGEFDKGLIDDGSRRRELIDIWTEATNEVAASMQEAFPKDNNIYRMVSSGARGNWLQVSVAWCRTRRVRPSRVRSSPRTARDCRWPSTSSPPTVPARDWPTPLCAPPTPGTSRVVSSTSRRMSSSAKTTAVRPRASSCASR